MGEKADSSSRQLIKNLLRKGTVASCLEGAYMAHALIGRTLDYLGIGFEQRYRQQAIVMGRLILRGDRKPLVIRIKSFVQRGPSPGCLGRTEQSNFPIIITYRRRNGRRQARMRQSPPTRCEGGSVTRMLDQVRSVRGGGRRIDSPPAVFYALPPLWQLKEQSTRSPPFLRGQPLRPVRQNPATSR